MGALEESQNSFSGTAIITPMNLSDFKLSYSLNEQASASNRIQEANNGQANVHSLSMANLKDGSDGKDLGVGLPSMDRSLSTSSFESKQTINEDLSVKTIEFLRARLLSERSSSKATREQAELLTQKVEELEKQLEKEVELRKKAEAAMQEAISRYNERLLDNPAAELDNLKTDKDGDSGAPENQKKHSDVQALRTESDDAEPVLDSHFLRQSSHHESIDNSKAFKPGEEHSSSIDNRATKCEKKSDDGEDDQFGLSSNQKKGLTWDNRRRAAANVAENERKKNTDHSATLLGRTLIHKQSMTGLMDGESNQKRRTGKSVRQLRKRENWLSLDDIPGDFYSPFSEDSKTQSFTREEFTQMDQKDWAKQVTEFLDMKGNPDSSTQHSRCGKEEENSEHESREEVVLNENRPDCDTEEIEMEAILEDQTALSEKVRAEEDVQLEWEGTVKKKVSEDQADAMQGHLRMFWGFMGKPTHSDLTFHSVPAEEKCSELKEIEKELGEENKQCLRVGDDVVEQCKKSNALEIVLSTTSEQLCEEMAADNFISNSESVNKDHHPLSKTISDEDCGPTEQEGAMLDFSQGETKLKTIQVCDTMIPEDKRMDRKLPGQLEDSHRHSPSAGVLDGRQIGNFSEARGNPSEGRLPVGFMGFTGFSERSNEQGTGDMSEVSSSGEAFRSFQKEWHNNEDILSNGGAVRHVVGYPDRFNLKGPPSPYIEKVGSKPSEVGSYTSLNPPPKEEHVMDRGGWFGVANEASLSAFSIEAARRNSAMYGPQAVMQGGKHLPSQSELSNSSKSPNENVAEYPLEHHRAPLEKSPYPENPIVDSPWEEAFRRRIRNLGNVSNPLGYPIERRNNEVYEPILDRFTPPLPPLPPPLVPHQTLVDSSVDNVAQVLRALEFAKQRVQSSSYRYDSYGMVDRRGDEYEGHRPMVAPQLGRFVEPHLGYGPDPIYHTTLPRFSQPAQMMDSSVWDFYTRSSPYLPGSSPMIGHDQRNFDIWQYNIDAHPNTLRRR